MGHCKVLNRGVSSMSPHDFLWLHKSSSAGLPLLMCWRHWSCTLRSLFTHIRSGLAGMRGPSGDQYRGTAFPLPTCPSSSGHRMLFPSQFFTSFAWWTFQSHWAWKAYISFSILDWSALSTLLDVQHWIMCGHGISHTSLDLHLFPALPGTI